ncbi:serine/threonine-protein kinase, partial [Myxococcota bacterium]
SGCGTRGVVSEDGAKESKASAQAGKKTPDLVGGGARSAVAPTADSVSGAASGSGSWISDVESSGSGIRPAPTSSAFMDPNAAFDSDPAHLEIVSRLGKGGMGCVFLALDRSLNRQVALKIMIDPPEEQSERYLKRFSAEAALPGRISHPNVIAIFGTGKHEGRPFFLMEYIPGSVTLGELIDRHEEEDTLVPIPLLTEYLRQATAGLVAVHSTPGLWHRDVKPDNMLVFKLPGGGDGLKLIDFGIAHDPDKNLTELDERLGTSAWMPPECFMREGPQFDFVPLDHRADLFALGGSFYEAFTGRHPYPMIEDRMTAKETYDSPDTYPAPPSRYRPEVPPGVDTIIMKLLERRRDERYQNAHEVLADLDRVAELPAYVPPSPTELAARHATPIAGAPLMKPPVAEKTLKSRTLLWVATALILAGAIVVVVVAALGTTSEPTGSLEPVGEVAEQEAPEPTAVDSEKAEAVEASAAAAEAPATVEEPSSPPPRREQKAAKKSGGRLPRFLKPGGEF